MLLKGPMLPYKNQNNISTNLPPPLQLVKNWLPPLTLLFLHLLRTKSWIKIINFGKGHLIFIGGGGEACRQKFVSNILKNSFFLTSDFEKRCTIWLPSKISLWISNGRFLIQDDHNWDLQHGLCINFSSVYLSYISLRMLVIIWLDWVLTPQVVYKMQRESMEAC